MVLGPGATLLDKPSESYEDPPVDLSDPRIQQATYNIFADGGVQPQTPAGVVIDGNEPPKASFTATPNPTTAGSLVTFNASGTRPIPTARSSNTNGTSTATAATRPTPERPRPHRDATRTPEEVTVRLRVTDNGGATDQAVRALVVSNGTPGNIAPKAAFTISPNPASIETLVSFNGAGSSDPDGTIVKYEWDLDGNGSYETNTGHDRRDKPLLPERRRPPIGLRVTDNGSGTATSPTLCRRPEAALPRPKSWHPGHAQTTGASARDRAAPSPTPSAPARRPAQGGFALGAPGAIEDDLDTAASFDGATGAASATSTSPPPRS